MKQNCLDFIADMKNFKQTDNFDDCEYVDMMCPRILGYLKSVRRLINRAGRLSGTAVEYHDIQRELEGLYTSFKEQERKLLDDSFNQFIN